MAILICSLDLFIGTSNSIVCVRYRKYLHLTINTTVMKWLPIGVDAVCNEAAGEVFINPSPGKKSNLEACKAACESNPDCQSISLYGNGWCSLYSTRCEETFYYKNGLALRLNRAATRRLRRFQYQGCSGQQRSTASGSTI